MDSDLDYRPNDLLRFVDCLGGALVPGTDAVVYVANTLDGSTASDTSALWLVAAGQHRRLVPSDARQAQPAISPDGSLVAFLQQTGTAHDDPWQLAVCARSGGEATVLTEFARGTGQAGPVWSPDGTRIAVDASDIPRRDPKQAYRITRLNWRLDGMGLVDDHRGDVWVVPAAGGVPRCLTADDGVISFLEWSPDGESILYGTFGAGDDTDYAIRAVDVSSGDCRTITCGPLLGDASVAAWIADGKVVYSSPWKINKRIELVVCDPRDGTHETRMPDPEGQLFADMVAGFDPRTITPRIVVDAAGEWAYVYVQQGGALRTTRVALAGEVRVEPLTDVNESVVPVGIDGARLLAIRTSHTRAADLVVVDTKTGRLHAVTALNGTWLTDMPFDVHHLTYPTTDGHTEIEGWYLAPRDGTGPYPTVLHIHGGPFAVQARVFNVDNLLLAAAGYGVLMVNFLVISVRRRPRGNAHRRLGPLRPRRCAPSGRCGCRARLGGQHPGRLFRALQRRLPNLLAAHPQRPFRAGISECLVSDWTGMLGSDKAALVAASMDSSPGHGPDSMEPYMRMAPATYAARCSAPLLVLEHEDDLRCPISQGDVLYNGLKLAGKVTEMFRLPGVSHDPFGADLALRVQRAEAILDWMDRWLKPTDV